MQPLHTEQADLGFPSSANGTGAERVWNFGRKYSHRPLLSGIGRFCLPVSQADFLDRLKSLHKIRSLTPETLPLVQQVDRGIGLRLAAAKIHATELLDPKLHPHRPELGTIFDDEVRRLATLSTSNDCGASASNLGLAYAIWLYGQTDTAIVDAGGAFSIIHEVFRSLAQHNLLDRLDVISFCQRIFCHAKARGIIPHRLVLQLTTQPDLLEALLLAGKALKPDELSDFAQLVLDPNFLPYEIRPLEFLRKLLTCGAGREAIALLLNGYRASRIPVFEKSHPLHSFRLPGGISSSTLELLLESRDSKGFVAILERVAIPFGAKAGTCLSPTAQEFWWFSNAALERISASISRDELANLHLRLQKFLRQIHGLDLSDRRTLELFNSFAKEPQGLVKLLSSRKRENLAQKLESRDSREAWCLAKILKSIDTFSAAEISLLSTCLSSEYLFDTTGKLCNAKTFRDFQTYVDSDLNNLRCFFDFKHKLPVQGHVRRLVSFIHESITDPNNYHYTNLENKRTRAR